VERDTRNIAEVLSPRERQLLVLAAQGQTDNAISHRLGISLATVGTYWGRIRIKMGPLNRTELVAVFLREEASQAVSKLKEENERLLHELEDRVLADTETQMNLEMFRALLEAAPDAIVVVDEAGIIVLANEQAEDLFGYVMGEFRGMCVEELVPERYRNAHVANRGEYMRNPVRRRMGEHTATMARRKDGSEFPMATALSATETSKGLLVTCIIRDLSEQWQFEPDPSDD
jgi:PAS domain S-box-containing protein